MAIDGLILIVLSGAVLTAHAREMSHSKSDDEGRDDKNAGTVRGMIVRGIRKELANYSSDNHSFDNLRRNE
jgi:hypothetical protein